MAVFRITSLISVCSVFCWSKNTVCESGYCYKVQNQTADWLEAQRLCVLKGMTLSGFVPLTLTGDKFWVLNNQTATAPNSIQTGHCMSIQKSATVGLSTKPCYQQNSYVCQTAYPRECLLTGRGNEYMGTTSRTREGLKCEYWTNVRTSQLYIFPDKDVTAAQNYCRNIEDSRAPWCRVIQNGEQLFKYCSIPTCAQPGTCFKQPFIYNKDVKCTSNSCYVFVRDSVHSGQNWLSADKCCQSMGGELMAAGDMTSVLQLIKPDTQAWIGAANFGQNIKFDATLNSHTCPYLPSTGGPVQYEDCTNTNRYVCRKENAISTDSTSYSTGHISTQIVAFIEIQSTTIQEHNTTSAPAPASTSNNQTTITVTVSVLVVGILLLATVVLAVFLWRRYRAPENKDGSHTRGARITESVYYNQGNMAMSNEDNTYYNEVGHSDSNNMNGNEHKTQSEDLENPYEEMKPENSYYNLPTEKEYAKLNN